MATRTTKTVRRQKPVRGGREQLPSCVEGHIWDRVQARARKFNCSRSWVTAVALADHLGITLEPWERYDYALTLVHPKPAKMEPHTLAISVAHASRILRNLTRTKG